jgi:hypothetical protein
MISVSVNAIKYKPNRAAASSAHNYTVICTLRRIRTGCYLLFYLIYYAALQKNTSLHHLETGGLP